MTNTEMLAQLRSFLDEATADFYADATELYGALSNAQIELARALADDWKQKERSSTNPINPPKAILPLRTLELGTINSGVRTATITAAPLQFMNVNWQSDGAVTATSPWLVELSEGGNAFRMMFNNKYLRNG